MIKSPIHISKIIPKKEDKYFFDTNIWMHLFCSVGNYYENHVNAYNTFFRKVLEANSLIFTTSLQLSEFFNAYCKVEYNILKASKSSDYDYKRDFRKSNEFEEVIEILQLIVSDRILKNSIKLNDNFNDYDINDLFKEKRDFDFNDQYFLKQCLDNSIKIVTHDKDFFAFSNEIDILTNHFIK